MEPIRALAAEIEQAWRRSDYDDRVFHRIAAEALEGARVHDLLTVDDIVDRVFGPDLWPVPLNGGGFGQPPIPLVTTPRFYVEALLWLHGSTSIHQHSFEGAFTVLAGESIATDWRFHEEERVASQLRLGRLSPVAPSRLLTPGTTVPIPAGARFVHAVYHRVQPTVTVVVRTSEDPEEKLQYAYTRSGVAMDPFPTDRRFETVRQTLEFLRTVDEDQFVGRLFDLFVEAPLWDSLRLLERYAPLLSSHGVIGSALQAVHRRHGTARTSYVARVVEESAWARSMQAKLEGLEGHALLCAQAALTCATLEDAVQLVHQRYPDHEPATIEWFAVAGRCPPVWASAQGRSAP